MSRTWTLWAVFAVFVVTSWVKLFGGHLLLLDFANHRFEFAFYVVEANTYQLIAAFVSFGLLVGIFMSIVLSHMWCGRFCPNTLFLSYFENKHEPITLRYFKSALFAAVFSFSLISYFIPANELFYYVVGGKDFVCVWFFYSVFIFIFALIVLLKRWYCSYLCVYGAMCNILPKIKRRPKVFWLILAVLLVFGVVFIFDGQNLEYCDFTNKELHIGR